MELFDYLAPRVEYRRTRPADDLITLAGTAPLRDEAPLTVPRAVAQLALLLAAGNETTANLIGNGMTLLIYNPCVQRQLGENAALLTAGIDEMLRLDPPFHFLMRKVVKPTMMGWQTDDTWRALQSAHPRRKPRSASLQGAERLQPRSRQQPAPRLIHGIHFCLGAPLARMAVETVFGKLLERYPHFTAGAEPAVRKTEAIISRGWLTRPVSFRAQK